MTEPISSRKPATSLTEVLGQTKQAKALVQSAATDLSSVNAILKEELTEPRLAPALAKSETVEENVTEAANTLSEVNRALSAEVRARHQLEDRLLSVEEHARADHYAALHDSLTGLPNRALFRDRLEQALAQARRKRWPVAVLFADLDNFKEINDVLGHSAGDTVLHTIATRLNKSCRAEDTVSRYGGDEFLYLLSDLHDDQNIAMIATKIVNAIRAPCELVVDGATVTRRVGASIGIAVFPRDGNSVDQLIKCADAAMYEAKRTGSGYVFARNAATVGSGLNPLKLQ